MPVFLPSKESESGELEPEVELVFVVRIFLDSFLRDALDSGWFFNLLANKRDSLTVRWQRRWSCWDIKESLTSLQPENKMSPDTPFCLLPAMHSRRVVFPQPEGPMMAVSSPDLNEPFKLLRMTDWLGFFFEKQERDELALQGAGLVSLRSEGSSEGESTT